MYILKVQDGDSVSAGDVLVRAVRKTCKLTQVCKTELQLTIPLGREVRVGETTIRLTERYDRFDGSTQNEIRLEAPKDVRFVHHKAAAVATSA